MKSFSLNGPWTLEIPGSSFGAVPARVPGSVYHDLLTAELIPDPFYRDNETEALKLMEYDFHYPLTDFPSAVTSQNHSEPGLLSTTCSLINSHSAFAASRYSFFSGAIW